MQHPRSGRKAVSSHLQCSEEFRIFKKKNSSQHNFVSFFTQVNWSGIIYVFPETKKLGRYQFQPLSFSLVSRGKMRIKGILSLCASICKVLDLWIHPGWKHLVDTTEMLSVQLGKWSSKLQLEPSLTNQLVNIRGSGKHRRMSCSPGSLLGLQTPQCAGKQENAAGNRKMKLWVHVLLSRNFEILKLNRTEMEGIS